MESSSLLINQQASQSGVQMTPLGCENGRVCLFIQQFILHRPTRILKNLVIVSSKKKTKSSWPPFCSIQLELHNNKQQMQVASLLLKAVQISLQETHFERRLSNS